MRPDHDHRAPAAQCGERGRALAEELLAPGEVVAEQGKARWNEPRPSVTSARPPVSPSRVANRSYTLIGSSELSTVDRAAHHDAFGSGQLIAASTQVGGGRHRVSRRRCWSHSMEVTFNLS